MRREAPALITIDQAAERLGTSPRHVRRLIAERGLPYIKVGQLVRFDPDDVNAWIAERRREARADQSGASVRRSASSSWGKV